MQLIFYDVKLLHFVAIFSMLIATSIWYFADIRGSRTMSGFHVFGVLLVALTGYYLSKRLTYIVGPKVPNWLIVKYVLTGVVGVILPLARTFKPQFNKWYFGINIALFIGIVFLAVYKPI